MTDVPTPPRVAGVDLKSGTLKIVAPARGTYPQVAERLRRALEGATGQDVTITDDSASPDETGTAVALGNLMDSAFVRRLYLAWFDWTDAAWPGPGGWALRVVADPWGTGGDVVLAGGSDEGGVAAAAEALARRVERDGTTLPMLHEVQLGARAGDYRGTLDPMLEPGYDWREAGGGGSGSWEFMMRIAGAGRGFLYTGDARFLELYRDQLLRFFDTHWFNRRREEPVQIHGFIHHLLLPWELTEHQPVYSDEHRRQVFESFLNLYRSTEGAARPVFLSQLKRRNVRGNHDTRNALDLYFGGRYFRRAARLPEAQDWLRLADDFLAPQAGSSKPWEDSWGHQWIASLYNVAVYKAAAGDEAYFRSRPFLDAVDRAIIAHSNLRRGPLNYFAIAAAVTGNREYLHPIAMLNRQRKSSDGAEGILAGRLGGDEVGRAFWTGWAPVEPGRLLGVAVAPLDRLYHETAKERDGAYASVAMENVPLEKGFDKVSFREGFDVRDQYLLLDGISGGGHSYQDANCIVSFEALGKVWINAFATGGRPASVREQNGVNIVRDGRGPGREPRFACLHDAGDFGEWGAAGSSLLDLNGAAWHRHIFWRRGSYFLVVDEVEAQEGGDYLIEPTWHVSGEVKAGGRTLTASQGEAHLTMQHTGSDWTEAEAHPANRQHKVEITRWRQRLRASLKAGDRRALATLFYATGQPMPEMFRLGRTAEGWRVEEERGGTAFGLRGRARGEDLVEARAWTASPEEVLLWGCSWLACGGLMLTASAPVGIRIANDDPPLIPPKGGKQVSSPFPSGKGAGGIGPTFDRGVEFWAGEEVELRIKATPGTISVEHAGTGEVERVWTDGEGRATVRLRAGRSRVGLPAAWLYAALRGLLGDEGERRKPALSTVEGAEGEKGPAMEAPRVAVKKGKDLALAFETALEGAANGIAVGQDGFSVGTEGGVVASVGPDGKVRWTFRSEKAIRALLRQDLDGDGEAETAAGGDAETLYLFGPDGGERWRHRIVWQPMQWDNWSQLDCKVLSLGAGDLNGDGRNEVVAGGADRHCYAFSLDGERLWRSPVQWGPMVCCAVADVDGDGLAEALGGTADPAIHGYCIVYRGDGRFDRHLCRPDVHSWSIPSWMVTMRAEDIDGDGRVEVVNGVDTNHRHLIVYRYDQGVVWDADFGGGVCAVATGGSDGDRRVYGGSAGGFVQAFTSKGERLWWRFLAERVAGLAAFGERVVAATASGAVAVFDAGGEVRQALRLPSGVRSVAGRDNLFVVGREDGVVQGFRVH